MTVALLIPRGSYNHAPTDGIPHGKVERIGSEKPARSGIERPLPSGPEDRDDRAFPSSRRHVNQEFLDLPCADGLQVIGDRVDMKVRNKRRSGFDEMPCGPDKEVEISGEFFAFKQSPRSIDSSERSYQGLRGT